jgi:hypothetical protein
MTRDLVRGLIFAALGIVCSAVPASAASRAVGDQFVYTLKTTIDARCPPVCRPSHAVNMRRHERRPTAR